VYAGGQQLSEGRAWLMLLLVEATVNVEWLSCKR
jgi:hypothetical protein